MKFIKKQATTAFKILFAIGLVFWLIKTDRFNIEDLKPFLHPLNFLTGFVLIGLNLLLTSERWRILMKSHSLHSSIWSTWKLTLTGIFFNFAVPGGVGGDVVKAYYLQKDLDTSRSAAFSSTLIDRLIGLYTLVMMAFIALVYERLFTSLQSAIIDQLFLWVSLLLAALTMAALFLTYFKWPALVRNSKGFMGLAFRFAEACQFYFRHPKNILSAILLTLFAQLITIILFYWALTSVLQENVSWTLLFFVVPVGFMAMAVPITPAGLGVGQAAFYFLFQSFSSNQITSGSSVITAFQVIQFAWGILGAYYYLVRKTRTPLPSEETSL